MVGCELSVLSAISRSVSLNPTVVRFERIYHAQEGSPAPQHRDKPLYFPNLDI